jgi:hypothetical protein
MVADADNETLADACEPCQRAIVYRQEIPGMVEKGNALRGELDVPRSPLHEPAAQPLFESLKLQADGRLRRLHGFRRTREAAQVRDTDKRLNGIEVERARYHF